MKPSPRVAAALSAVALSTGIGGAAIAASSSGPAADTPSVRLITNERTPMKDANWTVTSGSLFDKGGVWWTGAPDGVDPNTTSSNGTGSDIFRVVSKSRAFENVRIDGTFKINRYASTPRTPAVAWDGAHLFLRYQGETNLYYASVARRDGAIVLKKKCHGGTENGGTYYTLKTGRAVAPVGQTFTASAGATTGRRGVTTVWLQAGATRIEAVDTGIGCPAIAKPGGVGVRGDNVDLDVHKFETTPLLCVKP